MAESEGAKNTPVEQQVDSAKGVAGESALKAIAHLQKVAETLAADAARLDNSARDDAKREETSNVSKAESVEIAGDAATSGRAAPEAAPKAVSSDSRNAWRRAAAVVALGAAVAASGYLGMRDGAARREPPQTAAVEHARPAPEKSVERELRAKLEALTMETQGLRALAQKQAAEIHSLQARAVANAAANTQTTARLDKLDLDISARINQQTARVERLERLAADPIVTSAIDKNKATPHKAEPARQGLRTPDASMSENTYVLRSVRNGVAVVQTRRGLIEVGPGDTIPGVGLVRRIEKVDGRWVVVMRDGVIDSD